MKKIAIITPFLAQGGLEKVAVTGAEYLKNHFDTTMIVFDTFKVDYEYSGKIVDLKTPLYGLNPINKIISLIKIMFKLKELQKKENYYLIIVHGELANISTLLNFSQKKIVVIHENRLAKKSSKLKNDLFNILANKFYKSKNTKKIVTVSEGIRQSFIKNFQIKEDKIQTIYNPYEIDNIIRLSDEKIDAKYNNLFNENDILLTVARFTEAKGHSYLITIFNKYKEENRSAKLVLFGDGELRDELIKLSMDLNLKTYSIFDNQKISNDFDVYFLGFNNNPYKYMKNSKVFIMSSLWEGFGNTLVESMASNTPVLSTDCESGPKEIISPKIKKEIIKPYFGEFGTLMPRFKNEENINYKYWIDTLEILIKDKETYTKYQTAGLSRSKDFDISIIMKQWRNLIESELEQ